MGTTTVRLDAEDEALLDKLASRYGGRSAAIREALRLLADQDAKQRALGRLLDEWEAEAGPVDEEAVQAMIDRYGL